MPPYPSFSSLPGPPCMPHERALSPAARSLLPLPFRCVRDLWQPASISQRLVYNLPLCSLLRRPAPRTAGLRRAPRRSTSHLSVASPTASSHRALRLLATLCTSAATPGFLSPVCVSPHRGIHAVPSATLCCPQSAASRGLLSAIICTRSGHARRTPRFSASIPPPPPPPPRFQRCAAPVLQHG
ncbi:hypothetical protein DFH06DRAFT_1234476 [Mycena polygramma]|nr:hypothetical protein DFH06DRAFT_1234476 [Mycena polygramma]